jgi:hypothetical protein
MDWVWEGNHRCTHRVEGEMFEKFGQKNAINTKIADHLDFLATSS